MDKQESIDYAKNFVENILSFFEVNVIVDVIEEEDIVTISVPSNTENSLLIGRNAETLRSLQSLASSALYNSGASVTRINIDIADYKKQRAEKITQKAEKWISEVKDTGDSKVLNLNAADRRIVHRVASEYSDIRTFSEGEGRDRRIIIAQASS